MAEGWIRLPKDIINSNIWINKNAFRVWLYLLLTAKEDGTAKVSRQTISDKTGLSDREVRTAFKVLGATNETTNKMTSKTTNKGTIVKLAKYDDFFVTATNETTNKATNETTNKNSDIPIISREKEQRANNEDKELQKIAPENPAPTPINNIYNNSFSKTLSYSILNTNSLPKDTTSQSDIDNLTTSNLTNERKEKENITAKAVKKEKEKNQAVLPKGEKSTPADAVTPSETKPGKSKYFLTHAEATAYIRKRCKDDRLADKMCEWADMRYAMRKDSRLTQTAIDRSFKTFERYGYHTAEKAIACLQQSIDNLWAGLFRVKKDGGSG